MGSVARFARIVCEGTTSNCRANALPRLRGSRHEARNGSADAVAIVKFEQGVRFRGSCIRGQSHPKQHAPHSGPGRAVVGDLHAAAAPAGYEATLDAAAIGKDRGQPAGAGNLPQPACQGADLFDSVNRCDGGADEHGVALLLARAFAADGDFRFARLQLGLAG